MLVKALECIACDIQKSRLFNSNPEKFFSLFPELSSHEKKLLLDRNAAAIEGYIKYGSDVMLTAPIIVCITIIVFRDPHDKEGAEKKRFDKYWERVIGNCINLSHVPA